MRVSILLSRLAAKREVYEAKIFLRHSYFFRYYYTAMMTLSTWQDFLQRQKTVSNSLTFTKDCKAVTKLSVQSLKLLSNPLFERLRRKSPRDNLSRCITTDVWRRSVLCFRPKYYLIAVQRPSHTPCSCAGNSIGRLLMPFFRRLQRCCLWSVGFSTALSI